MSQRCYTCGRESPQGWPLLHFEGCEVGTPRPGQPTLESALRAADLHIPDAAVVIREHLEALRTSRDAYKHDAEALLQINKAATSALEQAERERDALRLAVDELRGLLVEVRNQRFFILHCPDGFLGRIDAALTRNLAND